jgi:hypothetical protein
MKQYKITQTRLNSFHTFLSCFTFQQFLYYTKNFQVSLNIVLNCISKRWSVETSKLVVLELQEERIGTGQHGQPREWIKNKKDF